MCLWLTYVCGTSENVMEVALLSCASRFLRALRYARDCVCVMVAVQSAGVSCEVARGLLLSDERGLHHVSCVLSCGACACRVGVCAIVGHSAAAAAHARRCTVGCVRTPGTGNLGIIIILTFFETSTFYF